MIAGRNVYILVGIIVVVFITGFLVVAFRRPSTSNQLDETAFLQTLWTDYKQRTWDSATGRTIDHQNGEVTTSEGQSYTMLRAVWTDDRPTFDKTWQWTAANLQRPDKLFSWRYGTRADGSSGVLSAQGGENTASDADTMIALALIMAGQRWHQSSYTAVAKQIIPAIWSQEVVTVNGQPYLTADNQEQHDTASVLLNPSYFAPYAYRAFAKLDTGHDWNGVIASSYHTIQQASQSPLGGKTSAGVPPDWVRLDRRTGDLGPPASSGLTTDFGFDAFRTIWQVALDWHWSHDPRAANTLSSFGFLAQAWQHDHKLVAIYSHDGQPKAAYESTALYGGTLPYFQAEAPQLAKTILQQKLATLYDARAHALTKQLSYYDNNWAWFGIALNAGRLTDYTAGGTP